MNVDHYKIRIVLSSNVVKKLKKFEQQKNNKSESGGILLGKVFQDHILVEQLTTPNIYDKWGRYFFIRSKIPAQKVINKIWKSSFGKIIYLGEWHTHSEIDPKPSMQDRNMIKRCLENTKMEIEFLTLIIIGLSGTLWVGIQSIDSLIKLSLQENSKNEFCYIN